ncbi:hypothetical protein C5167_044081 [Papaver somniferum]|uniref:Uncharacterized protein n=1 Tax=Papaver somniferum TaxID=3469 RepID=A0A4Y7LBF6_PAPSO|nr:putative F-box protein At3g17490 [Papaver somniferum]XP_026421172.1 putative F-box protein At3g17490 [Papaver somniferum]RZC81509.1 hypothetical protein C5167_044081 [Papaver somniferum]
MEVKKGYTKLEDEECEIVQKLSSDAVYEILIRASFSTLLRQSRWVCKDWQKLIRSDSKFQQTHSQRTLASGHFFQVNSTTGRNSVSFYRSNNDFEKYCNSAQEVQSPFLDFLPTAKSVTIAGSTLHGSLLCCFTESFSTPIPSFYMCKPASREWRKMPNPKTTFKYSRIGIAVKQSSCSILHYKILRLSQSKTGYGYHCQLFNSETWAWKILPFVQFIKLDCTLLIGGDGIWINGGLHWLTLFDEVFVFNTDQEKWTTFEVPPEMKNISSSNRVAVNCDGKLGIIYQTLEWMEVWILENYSTTKPTWKKKYSIDMRSLQQNVEHVYYAHHMWSNNTVMMMSMCEFLAFNCDKNTYYTTTKLPMTADISSLAPYPFQPQFCYL